MNSQFREVAPAILATRLLWAFLLLWIGPELFAEALVRAGCLASPTSNATHVELSLAAFGIAALLVVLFAFAQPSVPFSPWRRAAVFCTYVPWVVGWTAVLVVYLQAAHRLGCSVAPQPQLVYFAHDATSRASWCLVAAVVVFAAPLAEEVVFRGYLHTVLRHWLSARATIVIGALVFGLLHGLPYALPVACLGLYFGWLRERSGSLGASICAHALHNGVVVSTTVIWPQSLDLLYPR